MASNEQVLNDGDNLNNTILSILGQKRKFKATKSYVWDHVDSPTINNAFVICQHCKTKYPEDNSKWKVKWSGDSTSNIIWHLKSVHKIYGPSNSNNKRKELDVLHDLDSEKNEDIEVDENICHNKRFTSKRQEIITEKLLDFMLKANIPMCLVNHQSFIDFVKSLNQDYKLPQRQTISYTLVPKMYENVKINVQQDINNSSYGSLTHDIWTSISQEAYLSATFHYVDKNYRLCSRVLGLYHLIESHKSSYITSKIKEILKEWNIENKALYAVADSGSNIKKALTDLDPLLKYYPCVGHKINLCAVDFLKKFKIKRYTNCKGRNIINIKKFNDDDELRTVEIAEVEAEEYEQINLLKDKVNTLIAKCKSLVGSFRHSEGLTKRLKEKQDILKYDVKMKLVQDVKTRWNSTYDMLDSIFSNKDALLSMKYENGAECIFQYVPSDDEFIIIDDFCNLFESLKYLTVSLSGRNYPTVSLLFPAVYILLKSKIANMEFSTDLIKSLKVQLINSLKSRLNYVLTNDIFVAATYLDFRYKKFEFVEDVTQRVALIIRAKKFITKILTPPMQQVTLLLQEAIDQTPPVPSNLLSNNVNNRNAPRHKNTTFITQLTDKFFIKPSTNLFVDQSQEVELEFGRYDGHLMIVNERNKIAIEENGCMHFYQTEGDNFKLLTLACTMIMCLSATSVASESLFSVAGIIQDEQRNRLHPMLLSMLNFIKFNIMQKY